MKYTYDLHIHSALSPCGDDDMTPNNIVNMAVVNGLDIIAVTDHNGTGNLKAIDACAKDKPLIFIPGIEVETVEEVHVICLFGTLEDALDMGKLIDNYRNFVKNDPNLFGRQLLFDCNDQVVGDDEALRIFSTNLRLEELFVQTRERKGCAVPAHVDRSANGIYSLLGGLPQGLNMGVVEVTNTQRGRDFLENHRELKEKLLLFSSDAHRLEDMNRGNVTLDIPFFREEITRRKVVDWLIKKMEG